MTEIDKLLHSLKILQEHKHRTFKLIYGEHNIDIEKLIKELNDN
jgi:hypothetical protein